MKHRRLESCTSTNDEARQAFEAGAPFPLLISTAEQTRGRGREGRRWSHLRGNFAGSFLLEATPTLSREPGLVSLLSGLAVREALGDCGAISADLVVKWPNDVLLKERKVAGILAEMVGEGARRAFVVGVGVNLRSAPDDTLFPATSVFGPAASEPSAFGDVLGRRLLEWMDLAEKQGGDPILDAFCQHAWRLGAPLAVRQGEETIEGIFTGLDRHGRMILTRPSGGQCTIAAGDTTSG